MRPRVAVVFDKEFAETLPLVREPIAALAGEGIPVDLLCRRQWSWTPIAGVELLPVAWGSDPAGARRSVATFVARAVRRQYCAIIATPVGGLIVADVVGRATGTPVVTLSDKLYTRSDYGSQLTPRSAMYRAQRRSAFTIMPDLARVAPLLAEAPLLRDHQFIELPNAPAGEPQSANPADIRVRLGLPPNDTLVLFAGTFWAGMGVGDCIAAIPSLPANTTMVIHAVDEVDGVSRALAELVETAHPLRFLPGALPYPETDDVFVACDIGIVFYRGTGPNFTLCGKASGKLARFLRAGRPVIVDRRGGLEWIAELGAGEIAETPEEVRRAIEAIRADEAGYRSRARACFEEHFRFESHWPAVRRALAHAAR